MRLLGRALRVLLVVNGSITVLVFLTATEGCQARLPFALPLSRPSDFVADSRGRVFVHSDFHRAVTVYDAGGNFVRNLAVPGGAGRGLLAVDGADRLYVNKADLLAVYDADGRLVETHAVPPGGERSWRLLPDGTVTGPVGPVNEALAWTLRPRRAVALGEVLFVDWIRKRRPMGILGSALLEDPFAGKYGARYEYRGFLAGILRIGPPSAPASLPPISPASARFHPSWVVALFTYPYSLLIWVVVPGFWFRARRRRARGGAAARGAAAVPAAGGDGSQAEPHG